MKPKAILELFKETFKEWQEDKVPRLAAALSYYTAFSLAPLLILAIAIAAFFFGEDAARGELVTQIQGLVGQQGGEAIQEMLVNAQQPGQGTIASVISIVFLLFGASGLFNELQDSLNTIWEVAPKPGAGIKNVVRTRFLSFAMVLGIGFLLLVSLVLSTVLSTVANYFGGLLPNLVIFWQVLNFAVTLGIEVVLFAMIYRILPDVKIAWSDVWVGAIITSVLFTIGKWLIGLYLGNTTIGSTYGAAGSFVVLLLWVNYSAQILFFGAEFTHVYANKYGSQIRPDDHAVPLTKEARAQQGIPRKEDLKAAAEESEHYQEEEQQERAFASTSVATIERRPRSRRRSAHPITIAIAAIATAFDGITNLGGRKKNRRNRNRR